MTRKKLAPYLKKAGAGTVHYPKITLTTPTPADATVVLKSTSKQPHPLDEVTNDVARPMKRIKKRAKKGEREIFAIFNQETRTSTLDAPRLTLGIEVLTRTLQNSSTPNVDQTATIHPMV